MVSSAIYDRRWQTLRAASDEDASRAAAQHRAANTEARLHISRHIACLTLQHFPFTTHSSLLPIIFLRSSVSIMSRKSLKLILYQFRVIKCRTTAVFIRLPSMVTVECSNGGRSRLHLETGIFTTAGFLHPSQLFSSLICHKKAII